ncbi:hypothetical protein B7P43_G04637 [Cryptotermes secundus]|uniref:GPI ethanolamine phosphate transferase 1 n=1 Tax=Cryptotermes secundus TaxID=105785 RepID=A0A2J7QZC8_9NEOP|nr:hypothetical protein B7P43_G04637 [Cryptotermes secundus]
MFPIIISFFVHIAFLVSVFGIYFKSPVVHDIIPQSSPLEALARRLVLMVADGLHADSFLGADDLFKANALHFRELPRDYLEVTEHHPSELMFSNAHQKVARYKKRELTEAGSLSWIYKEFSVLNQSKETKLTDQICSHIRAKRYTESISTFFKELIALSLLGLNYYQNYYQYLLLTCVTLAFLGWIACLLHSLVGDDSSHKKSPSFLHVQHDEVYQEHELLTFTHSRLFRGGCWVNIAFLFLVILTMGLTCIQMLPLHFYIYSLLPELIWWAVARHWAELMAAISHVRSSMGLRRLLIVIKMCVHISRLCLSSTALLSIGMLRIAVWPIVFPLAQPVHLPLLAGWLTCLFLAVFALPEEKRTQHTTCVTVYCAWRLNTHTLNRKNRIHSCCVVIIQLIMLPTAIWDFVSTAHSFSLL